MATDNVKMQKANFEQGYELITYGRITERLVKLDGASALLLRFPPGASVTEDYVNNGLSEGADMCEAPHVCYVLGGTLGVRLRDGSEETFTTGDIMLLPPGHDAWSIGDEDCVFIEFMNGTSDCYGYTPEF